MNQPRVHSNGEPLAQQQQAQPGAAIQQHDQLAAAIQQLATAIEQQQQGQPAAAIQQKQLGNDCNTMLLVATLITTLTYQVGTNIPGGYWQDTQHGKDDGKPLHMAGQPIMRDMHRPRYMLFLMANWAGLWSSILMTVSLLRGEAGNSRNVRWPFTVAYSSLVLTYMVSLSTKLSFAIPYWVGVATFLWLSFSPKTHLKRGVRAIKGLCCGSRNNNSTDQEFNHHSGV